MDDGTCTQGHRMFTRAVCARRLYGALARRCIASVRRLHSTCTLACTLWATAAFLMARTSLLHAAALLASPSRLPPNWPTTLRHSSRATSSLAPFRVAPWCAPCTELGRMGGTRRWPFFAAADARDAALRAVPNVRRGGRPPRTILVGGIASHRAMHPGGAPTAACPGSLPFIESRRAPHHTSPRLQSGRACPASSSCSSQQCCGPPAAEPSLVLDATTAGEGGPQRGGFKLGRWQSHGRRRARVPRTPSSLCLVLFGGHQPAHPCRRLSVSARLSGGFRPRRCQTLRWLHPLADYQQCFKREVTERFILGGWRRGKLGKSVAALRPHAL